MNTKESTEVKTTNYYYTVDVVFVINYYAESHNLQQFNNLYIMGKIIFNNITKSIFFLHW